MGLGWPPLGERHSVPGFWKDSVSRAGSRMFAASAIPSGACVPSCARAFSLPPGEAASWIARRLPGE
eukprot:8947225-Alexandrium_andersonii.AAC.1